MARNSYTFIDTGADEARGHRQPRPLDAYSNSLARRRQLIEAQSYSYIDRTPLPKQQYRYLDIKADELKGTFKSNAESEQRLLYYGQLDRRRHINLEPSAPQVTHHRQARPWEVIPGQAPGEEAPPGTPSDQPIRGYEPRAPVPPGRPPPYPGPPAARRALRGTYLPEYEQPVRPQRTPPSSPVEEIVDDGQFQFSPPASRRQLFPGSTGQPQAAVGSSGQQRGDLGSIGQQRAPLWHEVSPQADFPAKPAESPMQEQAGPETAPEAEFEVPPARAPMPAYHRGPSYASEVDKLAEPRVLNEDTILTPVAEGRYKRQRVTDGFSGSTGGSPTAAATSPIHPPAEVFPPRDVTLLYSWIDPRSDEFAVDVTKSKHPTGPVTSTLPPVAPRTVVRRYIDAPMADVARQGSEAPVLAPHEPLEERAAAARERRALHRAEEEVQVRLQEVDGRVSVAFRAPAPAAPEASEAPASRPQASLPASGAPSAPAAAAAEERATTPGARGKSRRNFSLLPFITPGGTGERLLPSPQPPPPPHPEPEPEQQPQPADSVNRQGRWKRMFSRKPKERKVPEVNVLPTPVLVPPEEEAEPGSPEVPPPPPQEAPAVELTPLPVRELPTGVTSQEALPGTTRVITARHPPPQPVISSLSPQPAPQVIVVDSAQYQTAASAVSGAQPAGLPGGAQAGMPGDQVTRAGASPLDISRMGGPQRAEREGAALTDAAERATAPKVAPPTFEEESKEEPSLQQMQSRAVPLQEVPVRGPVEYSAPVRHPPLGPGAAEVAVQRPEFEAEDAEEEPQEGQEYEAPRMDVPPQSQPAQPTVLHPPAQDYPAQEGPAGGRLYEYDEEAEEGGQEVEVQEEGAYRDEEQQPRAGKVRPPAEVISKDTSPSWLELQDQGVPGYGDPQESFKTAREGWTGQEPATEEPIESSPATEEPTQGPAHTQATRAVGAPQATPQQGGQDSPQQHAAEAEQGPSDWPEVTLPEHEEWDAGGADTRGQATQTAYPEQPRTPPATPAQQAATSVADISARRPSASAPEGSRGDQAHMVAGKTLLQEPVPVPGPEAWRAPRSQSAWAVPAAIQPGVPHVLPAESSDEEQEPEPEQETQATEEYHEQQQHQEGQSAGQLSAAQDTISAQMQHLQEAADEAATEEAGKEGPTDLEQQLRENAEQLQRTSASQTGVGIAETAFGPLAVPASAQEDRPGSRTAAENKQAQAQSAPEPATQPSASKAALTAEARKTASSSVGEGEPGGMPSGTPGGMPGRIIITPLPERSTGAKTASEAPPRAPAIGPPSRASFPFRSAAGTARLVTRPGGIEEYELREEHFFSPDEGYSTPPEDFAAGSPQSFTSEAGSSQIAEATGAGLERGKVESAGGSYQAEAHPASFTMVEGGSLGGSYQAVHSPQVHEREFPAADIGAAQPGEAATRPALASADQRPNTALSAPRTSQGEGDLITARGSLLRRDTPSPSAFAHFRAASLPREHTEAGIPEHEGEHEVGETGEHASPDELWPGMSAEASHAAESAEAGQGIADDSATWRADQATLQRALDQAMAQPIDPSRRPMWTDTSGMSETQGSEVPFYDAREGQEQGPHEPGAASEAPPVAQVTPPAPPTTPAVSPAFSVAHLAPETPTAARLPELPEEEMAPGRWHGASIRAPRRSKSREELKQVIAGISSKKSDGEEGPAMPAHQAPFQAPFPPDPEVQVTTQAAEEERMRMEDEERREWERSQGAGPKAEELQRQISFEERRGRERLADLAESTHRSVAEQQQRVQQIAGQGLSRIQQTRDEGISKITAVCQAAVQGLTSIQQTRDKGIGKITAVRQATVQDPTTKVWPSTDMPTAEEARAEWERRIAESPTVPAAATPTVKSEVGPEVRISQPAVRYSVPSGRAATEQGTGQSSASTQGTRTPASPFTKESTYTPVGRSQDDSEPLRPASTLKGQSRSSSLPEATSLGYPSRSPYPSTPLTAEEKGKGPAPSSRVDPGPSQVEWEDPEGELSAQSAQTQQPAPEQAISTGDSPALPAKHEPPEKKEPFTKRVKAMFHGGRRPGPLVKE